MNSVDKTVSELMDAFIKAKQSQDAAQLKTICKRLEQGFSQVPVWQRGQNRISHQRQRLSPCIRYLPQNQEPFYRAYVQAVLDPEYRQIMQTASA